LSQLPFFKKRMVVINNLNCGLHNNEKKIQKEF